MIQIKPAVNPGFTAFFMLRKVIKVLIVEVWFSCERQFVDCEK